MKWHGVVDKVVIPMVLSPLLGFGLSYLFMLGDAVVVPEGERGAGQPRLPVGARSRRPATMAFGHGTQDAQKTMGVIALTLFVAGHNSSAGRHSRSG